MAADHDESEDLIRRAWEGDEAATEELFARYRDRLRQMVTVRMDPRLAARLDASDVVQETLVEASRRLPEYLQDQPLPFYPWLRQIAWERLVDLHDAIDERRTAETLVGARLRAGAVGEAQGHEGDAGQRGPGRGEAEV